MDMNKLFTRLKELGHVNSKRDELREYCKLKFDEIAKYLPRRILNSDGGDVLDCIFNGLPDNSSKNKVKIVDLVLQVMRKESTSLTHCGDVISRLCLELPRLPVQDLVRWSNNSVQSIIEDNDVNMIWKDVLPECLSGLSAHSTVQHCGTTMSVSEYKEQCTRTLCQCNWRGTQLVQLTAMFREMQLPRNDHRQVVNKICSYVIDFPPDTLPPLLHQLLKLCKNYHIEIVLSHLSHYFSVRLYSKLEPPPPDSESTTMDVDDIVAHSASELGVCLSTCLYHVSAGACEPEVIRRHLHKWPRTQLLRNPFLVDLALVLSDKGADFRTVCLDVVRSAIEHRVMDGIRATESAWTRSVLPPDVDVAGLLKTLATESANHRQLTVVGLINLAFSLLAVSRTKPSALACWSHGKLILARLSKAQPSSAPHILSQLTDRLATDCHKQYADCLHVLCALTPVSLERCTQLTTILENCQPAPGDYRAAAAVLDAVHPLINFSTRVRDALVMVCRKGLYSRDSMHRCLALSGLLTVLRHVRAGAGGSCSQGGGGSEQYSATSYLTQITVDVHAQQGGTQVTSRVRNEAMCMEVVSILRRCLVQDAAVKQLLYTKLYECCRDKPVLHESVLELLYEQLARYLRDDGVSLALTQCVHMSHTATLTEPISYLLYATAQFLHSEEEELEDILSSQNADTGSAHLRSKLSSVLHKLCHGGHMPASYITDEPSITDLTPESKAKYIEVQQMVSCYEALIAHLVIQWSDNNEDTAARVYELFKASSQLLEQTKATPKIGKKGSKSALNETRETTKTQKSQKSQKDKGKAPMKASNLVKDRAGPFKPLPCVWDLKFCLRVLELLYNENVPWCSIEQRNLLRSKRDFHQWAVQRVASVVAATTDKRQSRTLQHVAAVLYSRIIRRFQDMCDFDEQTTLLCIDLFKDCLSLLLSTQFSLKMNSFLPTITDMLDSTASVCAAEILGQFHAALVQVEEDSDAEQRDGQARRLVLCLIQAAAVLLEAPVPASAETCAVVIKLEQYIRRSKQDCLPLIPPLLTACCREMKEAMLLEDLLIKLTAVLGKIDDEASSGAGEEPANFPFVDARSGHAALAHVCTHLAARHGGADHLLRRARDLATACDHAVSTHHRRIEKELHEVHKSLIVQLCSLTQWTSAVCSVRCVVGGGSDRVLSAALRLYALLAAHARHTPPTLVHIHTRSYERLLKISGKKLSSVTDNLITYLEASQQQLSANRVLRDTKLIPRLVLEAELFTKHVILLANKTKMNYQQYMSLGTARDFRIKGPALQEALNAGARRTQPDGPVDINDAETEVLSPQSEQNEEEEESDAESSGRKRRRVS